MINVLALVPDFIEKPSGGLGEQFRNIQQNLSNDVNYFICGYPEKNNLKNYNSVTSPIQDFKHSSLNTIFGQAMYFYESLKFKQNIDVVHAFDWSTFVAGVLCAWHLKKPLVCTVQLSLMLLNKCGIYYCHDPRTIDGEHINLLQRYYELLGITYANRVIHVSNSYKKAFNEEYPEFDSKSVVINNGIDVNSWVKKRCPRLPGKNKLKLCYIGRASPMKGLDTILNCSIPEDVDFYFVVSSKNAEEPFFGNIKKKCNNQNIFHIPGLYGQDKIDFLYAMDGVVMPSIHEPFGIVALEALISENLFITTAKDGIADIVNGIEYFKINNSEDLLESIRKIKLLTLEEKNKIINLGKNRAQNYNWKDISQQVLNVYRQVRNEKPIENLIAV